MDLPIKKANTTSKSGIHIHIQHLPVNIQTEVMKYWCDNGLYQNQIIITKNAISPIPKDLEWFFRSDAQHLDEITDSDHYFTSIPIPIPIGRIQTNGLKQLGRIFLEKQLGRMDSNGFQQLDGSDLYIVFARHPTFDQSDLIIAKQPKYLGQHLYEEINHTCFKDYYLDEYLLRVKKWYMDHPDFKTRATELETEDVETGEDFSYIIKPIDKWILGGDIKVTENYNGGDYDYEEISVFNSIKLKITHDGKQLKSAYKDFDFIFPLHHKTSKLNLTFINELISVYDLEIDEMDLVVTDNQILVSVEVTDTNVDEKYSWKFKWT